MGLDMPVGGVGFSSGQFLGVSLGGSWFGEWHICQQCIQWFQIQKLMVHHFPVWCLLVQWLLIW